MKSITELFSLENTYNKQVLQDKTKRTERGDLLTQFLEKMNQAREGFKPLTVQRIATLLSIYSTSDLYDLWKTCSKAKHFGKTFWYFVKPKQ